MSYGLMDEDWYLYPSSAPDGEREADEEPVGRSEGAPLATSTEVTHGE